MKFPLIGVSQAMNKVRELVEHVSDTGLNIIVTGESGVGKEVVAQNLYYKSPRNGKPFVKVNCAALPEGLLESELFGYEKGAFTGAEKKRRGKFELADKGVLFLDEIGDMPFSLQSKLLHVLQSGEFAPLGSETERKSDTWIIAATNHDLEQDIKTKSFREDLFYRLNIIKIHLPPLRERPEDVSVLVSHYIKIYSNQYNAGKFDMPDSKIMAKFIAYHWPGNVRELQNVLKRYMVIRDWDEILRALPTMEEAPVVMSSQPKSAGQLQPDPSDTIVNTGIQNLPELYSSDFSAFSLKKIRKKALDQVEAKAITHVLTHTGWNRSKAAKILRVSYKTLLNKITELNISPPSDSVL
ncbi:MAG: sigma-54 dependent transcriptional regulator [Proteobacteria bacterium]|nr:sigma-54 dependent transcriptional regulator [Pseudomonadota bacterium]